MRTWRFAGLVGAGLAWIVATVWYFQGPSLERLAAYLATAAGLFALDLFTRGAGGDDPSKAHDKALIEAFRSELPFRPTIEFLRDWSLGSTFPAKMTWPLDEFRLRWTDAAHEFEDKSLEEHRRALVKSAGELIIQIGRLTWDIGGERQSVKGATDVGEPPEAWEQRGDTLDALAEVVVKAHQDLERAARRWEGRRPVREVILAAMAIAILALPSFGLWRAERLRSQALRDSLAVVSRERDSLWKEVELLRSSEAASAAEATNDQVKSQIADLGKFVREGDEIKRKCLNGPYRPIDDESNWEQKVRGYLRRELGEAYAIRFEQAVVGSGLGFEGVPVAMSDLWFRVDGRQKCLATFVGELQAKQDGR